MSFLGLAFLFALPLAALPVVLHLFDRRRNVVIEWGAMQFLQEVAAEKTSARKLKQLLLVFLRMLTLALLILALAQPLLPGNWSGEHPVREHVVMLDNSLSMSRSIQDQTLFARAVEEARQVIAETRDGDYVRIMLTAPYPVWLTQDAMRMDEGHRNMLNELLSAQLPSAGRSDFPAALFSAIQAPAEGGAQKRFLHLLTDQQDSDWDVATAELWDELREVWSQAEVPLELNLVSFLDQSLSTSNIAINQVQSTRIAIGKGELVSLIAQVHNYSDQVTDPMELIWTVNGQEVGRQVLPPFNGESSFDAAFQHAFSESGQYLVRCELEHVDALPKDNQNAIVLSVVEQLPILIVDEQYELAESQQDSYFVQAALGWKNGLPLKEQTVYVPHVVDHIQLATIDLTNYFAVVIPSLQKLDPPVVKRLEEFVAAGGGLWIALGPRSEVDQFNHYLYSSGYGLAPLPVTQVQFAETSQEEGVEADAMHLQLGAPHHPATQTFARQLLDLNDVLIDQYFGFSAEGHTESTSVILQLTDEQPFLVERFYGQGRVMVQAVPLQLQWSSFARQQSFVVLVQETLGYLVQPKLTRFNLEPGESLAYKLAETDILTATLETPLEEEISLSAEPWGPGIQFRSSRTTMPGEYRLQVGVPGEGIPFLVNRHPGESDLKELEEDTQTELHSFNQIPQQIQERTEVIPDQQTPIWSLLFFIVIGLLSCELILSGMISRERFGIQQVAEGSESWAGMDSPDHAAEPGSFPVNTGSTTRPLHTTSPLQVSGSELN